MLDTEVGNMPPGHNGSYYDEETPVRNTSHWLITFLKAYSISQEKKFLHGGQKMAKYLSSPESRPMQATFWHRKNPNKDSCNGLIGQAWTIESLIIASQELEMPELLDLAEKVFLLHPFDEQIGLWRRVGVDGSYLNYDMTFNHQLWFAAIGSILAKYASEEVKHRIMCFMSKTPQNFAVYSSGVIRHLLTLNKFEWRKKLEYSLNRPMFNLSKVLQNNHQLAYKAIGYQSFNLYAFALLKQVYPDHHLWANKTFKTALEYSQSKKYFDDVENNDYGYPYNPTGLEMPFVIQVFSQINQLMQTKWLSKQINLCYDFDKNMMTKNTKDPVTLSSRLYEATRLPNLDIEIEY
ncbi:agl cluster protein AglQ [Hyella patelloides]|uniref:agl cluster protein AglQ n=1 Tax=Hyella patelloides TaxID=1982969 RepID=UPI0011A9D27D|nr:agl cluster protein AglQ [Hyella patelloides]